MKNLTIKESKSFIDKTKNLLILDVRTVEEYKDGHLSNSINIPLASLPLNIDQIIEFENNPLLVYCQRGGRSFQAVTILEDNGFTNIYNMANGFSAWTSAIEN